MRSAKTLAKTYAQWTRSSGQSGKPTIVVAGWETMPCEPLLLEALASHPGCNKLYFIPLDGPAGNLNRSTMKHDFNHVKETHDPSNWYQSYRCPPKKTEHGELLAYDVTHLLRRGNEPPRGANAIEMRLTNHFKKRELVPVSTSQADIYISAHGQPTADVYVARRNLQRMLPNDPFNSSQIDYKANLASLNKYILGSFGVPVTPPCKDVESLNDIRTFMDTHGYTQIVLKESGNSCGNGIFRVFRERPDGPLMGEKPRTKGEQGEAQVFTLTPNFIDPQNPMLAMEWLDNSKGDIRAVIVNGSCIGAYIRHHNADTWLCNHAQGGSIQPIDMKRDLSAADRRKLHAIAKALQRSSITHASIDLLANERGERFLSEINIGPTDDLIELSMHWDHRNAKFGRLSVADQVAADLMESYRDHIISFMPIEISSGPKSLNQPNSRAR